MDKDSSKRNRDSLDDLVHYYSINGESSRLQLVQLEAAITFRAFEKYLIPKAKILEIGAGPGNYTVPLAQKGHLVTAVELAPNLTEESKQRLANLGLSEKVTHVTGDARDALAGITERFDAVIVMGPLYHLVDESDRKQLMEQVSRLTKPGGAVMTSHVTRMGFVGYVITHNPQWLQMREDALDQIMSQGYLSNHPRDGTFRGYYTTAEEVKKSHQQAGLKVLKMHSHDPGIGSVDDIFNRLPDNLKAIWVDKLFNYSADPLALGSGRGILCVSRKE
jgi:cyclopropane fatty-acyl-phospholipid synthase-like methyltransferase